MSIVLITMVSEEVLYIAVSLADAQPKGKTTYANPPKNTSL